MVVFTYSQARRVPILGRLFWSERRKLLRRSVAGADWARIHFLSHLCFRLARIEQSRRKEEEEEKFGKKREKSQVTRLGRPAGGR